MRARMSASYLLHLILIPFVDDLIAGIDQPGQPVPVDPPRVHHFPQAKLYLSVVLDQKDTMLVHIIPSKLILQASLWKEYIHLNSYYTDSRFYGIIMADMTLYPLFAYSETKVAPVMTALFLLSVLLFLLAAGVLALRLRTLDRQLDDARARLEEQAFQITPQSSGF